MVLFYLYLFSLGVLFLLGLLTGDMAYVGFEKLVFLTFLFILAYAAMAVGGFAHHDDDEENEKKRLKK